MKSDSSPRTKAIARPYYAVIAAIIVFVLGVIGYIGGTMKFNNIVANSSSPVGSEITFSRSGATMTLEGIYTDVNQDVLIARLSTADDSENYLPFRGTDYNVVVSSPALKGYTEIPILFGRMSSDGDFFLILPKPSDQVYTVLLQNLVDLGNVESANQNPSQTDSNVRSIASDESSLSKALSEFTYEDGAAIQDTTERTTTYDYTALRLTMDPAFKDEMYRPQVIHKPLLDPETNEFDFKTMFQEIFKNVAIDRLTQEYNDLENQKEIASEKRLQFQQRLELNNRDSAAAGQVKTLSDEIEKIEEKQAEIAKNLSDYQNLEYDNSFFTDFATSAVVADL